MHSRTQGVVTGSIVSGVVKAKQTARGTSREQIVDVSRSIIEAEGVEVLTIRRIAETIDRTQPAVYQHFESKDAILSAVVVEGFAALVERLQRAARTNKSSIHALASAYVRFGLERPKLYDVMFVGPPSIVFAVSETPKPAQSAFEIFSSALAGSGFPPARLETATEVVWAALHGLVMLSITKRLRPGRALERARLEQVISLVAAMQPSK